MDLVRQARFHKAYIARYSPRPGTVSHEKMKDDVSLEEKRRRFHELDRLVLTLSGRDYLLESHGTSAGIAEPESDRNAE
jgi:tRNA A37 methylthiotransferase MiaB